MSEQTRRGCAQNTTNAGCGPGLKAALATKKAGLAAGEPRKRVNWLSVSPTKSLRTSRQCLDCWAL